MKMPKVQSATELRSHLYETLDEVARGEPQIITHKRGESVIIISQEKFNALIDEREVLREISIGTAELNQGLGIPHAIVKERMLKKIDSWK
jgi:prevent-host-death family protein